MFDANSRYAEIASAKLSMIDADGEERQIIYKRRRFIPSIEGGAIRVEHSVAQQDRLDNVTTTYLGDPAQFWRVCDANHVFLPSEATSEPGRRINIALTRY